MASGLLLLLRKASSQVTLRIQKSIEGTSVTFRLTGRIQADRIPEIHSLLESETEAGHFIFDLEQVRLVDREAVLFLALSETLGAKLINCSAYIRKWIDQERKAQ